MFSFNPSNTPLWLLWATERDEKKLQEFIDAHLTFTDKVSYIEWVSGWKKYYKELSVKIRSLKKEDRSSAYSHKIIARLCLAIRHAGKKKSWADRKALDAIFLIP